MSEEPQEIKSLWEQGLSITQIGLKLNRTRNSIAGFMNRNRELFGRKRQLNAKPKPVRQPAAKTGRPPRVAQPPKPVAESEIRIQVSENQESLSGSVPITPTKRFIDLSRNYECKWIMMTGFHDACTAKSPVCGRDAKLGEPYCTAHMKLAYNPAPRRPQKKAHR